MTYESMIAVLRGISKELSTLIPARRNQGEYYANMVLGATEPTTGYLAPDVKLIRTVDRFQRVASYTEEIIADFKAKRLPIDETEEILKVLPQVLPRVQAIYQDVIESLKKDPMLKKKSRDLEYEFGVARVKEQLEKAKKRIEILIPQAQATIKYQSPLLSRGRR